ncbi:membrane protein [Verrucomicrobiota bacterium]|nr:membrane protein [Verrucomicrobiota bacterium]
MFPSLTISWMPVLPPWLIALLTLALLALLGRGSLLLAQKRLPRRWIIGLGALRVAIVAVFALCLLQPIVSFRRTVPEGPPVLVLLDASLSMGIKDAAAPSGRLTESLRWLEQSGLINKLAARPNTHWFAFDSHARTAAPDDLATLTPNGATTRYGESLADASEHYRQQRSADAPLVPGGRVLLVSDGRDFGTRDATEVARQLGLVVDTLAPASAVGGTEPAQITIAQVQAPRRVLLGAESRFSVALRATGLAGKPLTLQLRDGDKLVATQPLTFAANESEKRVSVTFRPEEAGLKEYQITIDGAPASTAPPTPKPAPAAAPVNSPAGDTDPANTHKFSVQVVGTRNEVLFLEDNWRWEFKFLRRIFEDDPSFTLTAFLARGENAFVQLAEPDRKTQATGFPQSRAELAGFDALVIGSADPRRWPRGFARAVQELVVEEGKSLIVIGGPNLRAMLAQPPIAALLPVELSPESGTPLPGPVPVRVTIEGLATPFFSAPTGGPGGYWSALPPVDQIYPPLRKKPAATALVETEKLANAYGKLILMAEHTVGRGRVLFIGTDTLWKWQMLGPATEGPTPYQVFWQQALRALAPIRQSTGNVNLNLIPDRSRYEPGQTVALRAEVQAAQALPKARVQAQVTLPDGKQLPLDFVPDPAAPGSFTARFEATRAGQHKVAATVIADDKTAADALIAFDVEAGSAELTDARINDAGLRRIARDTGGQHLDRADPATWRALESLEKVPVVRVQTVDLWNRYVLLLLLSALLGLDWLLRLLRGFA